MAAGRWPLAAGRWPLAAGRSPLASDRIVTAWIPLQVVPISANMARHGFAFEVGRFERGEVSFHPGWPFHKAGPNTGTRPLSPVGRQ